MTIIGLAWQRFKVITKVVGDVQGRILTFVFYFSIIVPFGISSRLFTDPLQLKTTQLAWQPRQPAATDLDSAREQG